MTSDCLYADPVNGDRRNRWHIRCRWDGSVTVWLEVWSEPDDAPVLVSPVMESAVRPIATVATSLLRTLGGFGRAHATLRFETGGFRLVGGTETRGFPSLTMEAWTG